MIYLDNAATSYPKPPVVWETMEHCLRDLGGSYGRGAYRGALDVSRIVLEARQALASLFNVTDSRQIIFTSNATQALNTALFGFLKPGDHVVATSMEHNSVVRPLNHLARHRDVTVTFVPSSSGGVSAAAFENSIRSTTRMFVVNHASNVTGVIQPVAEIGAIAERHRITYLVDAAQTAGTCPIDVERSRIDMLAFPGHKNLLGPTGTGGLYIRKGLELEPLLHGGTGSRSELEEQPPGLPDRFECGTLNSVGIAGLSAAARFLLDTGIETIRTYKIALTRLLLRELAEIEELTVYGSGNPDTMTSTVSINIRGMDPSMVSHRLDSRYGISVRIGLHCAPHAHKTIGTFPRGTVRLSPGYFTREEEIEAVVRALKEITVRP